MSDRRTRNLEQRTKTGDLSASVPLVWHYLRQGQVPESACTSLAQYISDQLNNQAFNYEHLELLVQATAGRAVLEEQLSLLIAQDPESRQIEQGCGQCAWVDCACWVAKSQLSSRTLQGWREYGHHPVVYFPHVSDVSGHPYRPGISGQPEYLLDFKQRLQLSFPVWHEHPRGFRIVWSDGTTYIGFKSAIYPQLLPDVVPEQELLGSFLRPLVRRIHRRVETFFTGIRPGYGDSLLNCFERVAAQDPSRETLDYWLDEVLRAFYLGLNLSDFLYAVYRTTSEFDVDKVLVLCSLLREGADLTAIRSKVKQLYLKVC